MSSIHMTVEDPRSTISAALLAELTAELGARYPDIHNGDGSGSFNPDDVLVPGAAFVVAWRGSEAIGCGALRPMNTPGVAEVKRMYVRAAARGLGISRLILSSLEDLARTFGYRAVMLETGTRQPEAIGLYESAGYQRTDCYGIYVDEPLSVCYQKQL